MKIKIINTKLEDYNNIFKVRRMNFNEIIVNYPSGNGLKSFIFEDVQCISENEIDEFLINNREFLKIKLRRGISVAFYNALKESLTLELIEDIQNINVLRDKYKVNKRGIWDKELIIFINKYYPVEVIASGKNFKSDSYNIIINRIEKENFLELCHEEVKKIEHEIDQKKHMLSIFGEAITEIKNSDKIDIKLLI